MRGLRLIAAAALLAVAGCGTQVSARDEAQAKDASFDGMVKIAPDRAIHVACVGLDRPGPAVVLISGSQNAGDEWSATLKPGATKVSFDTIEASPNGVISQVAQFAPVCSYDRPGTIQLSKAISSSTPVQQPTTAQDDVADLHAALTSAGIAGPYVVVGHSWGGFLALLFASTYPDQTAGLVLVDPGTPWLQDVLTPAEWSEFLGIRDTMMATSHLEVPDYEHSMDAIRARPQPHVPTALLTSDKPFYFGVGTGTTAYPLWQQAAALAADALGATHITKTDSGHMIPIENPSLVAKAIHDVTEQSRNS